MECGLYGNNNNIVIIINTGRYNTKLRVQRETDGLLQFGKLTHQLTTVLTVALSSDVPTAVGGNAIMYTILVDNITPSTTLAFDLVLDVELGSVLTHSYSTGSVVFSETLF